ncbi:group II intron maturase-specific domain-containing protein [Haliovirga abyssi]|uniref:Reverse transcriptase domain-containing protein n=1 Tax=Haliovirga abyssi TaxID=2996794 RepID=A0AAU9DW97_9FUSO|nr:group II intron maturase-specific domain-containing protein [Haliovirga abyssi]BDU49475.1 hypothetical protein HLVA_00440 [Haliovirga abyssi]
MIKTSINLQELRKRIYFKSKEEKAKEVTKQKGKYYELDYARFADDLVVTVSSHSSMRRLLSKVIERLKEEFEKIEVTINKEKSRVVDLKKGGVINFLGFTMKRRRNKSGKWGILTIPQSKKRKGLLEKIKELIRRHRTLGIFQILVNELNTTLRGWVNYFSIGNSSKCFSYVRNYVEKKLRRYLMKQRGKKGYGWKKWSNDWLYNEIGLFDNYKVKYIPE